MIYLQQIHTHGNIGLVARRCIFKNINPIELIWGNLKGFVGRENFTFKGEDVATLIKKGFAQIDSVKGQIQRQSIFFKLLYLISNIKKKSIPYIFLSTHSDAIPVQNSVLFTITDTVISPVCYVIRHNKI